jgi:hypothetical protein
MSDPPPAAADEGVAFFQVDCATCGRVSDAPEATFLAGPVAPVRDTAFLLCRIKCEGRGTAFDRVFRPIDPRVLAGIPEIDDLGVEGHPVLPSYGHRNFPAVARLVGLELTSGPFRRPAAVLSFIGR